MQDYDGAMLTAGAGFMGAGVSIAVGLIASLAQIDIGGTVVGLDGGGGVLVTALLLAIGILAMGAGLWRIARDGVRVRIDATPATQRAAAHLGRLGASLDDGPGTDIDAEEPLPKRRR